MVYCSQENVKSDPEVFYVHWTFPPIGTLDPSIWHSFFLVSYEILRQSCRLIFGYP